jgi:hypothetical protein
MVPRLERTNVFVEPFGAETVRLLITIVAGKLPAVVASFVTVELPALVIRSEASPMPGAVPSDQLEASSHLPEMELIQELVWAYAARCQETLAQPITNSLAAIFVPCENLKFITKLLTPQCNACFLRVDTM